MCVVCGCSGTEAQVHGHTHPHEHSHEHPHAHPHAHAAPDAPADLHFGANAAHVSVPGMSAERAIQLEADVLGANDAVARANRAHFAAHGVAAYNLVSSPGSGKTTLLVATIGALQRTQPQRPLAVIEGDQQTSHDAQRIRATGAPAIQVNTGKGCHLDAPMVAAAFERLPLHAPEYGAPALLFIENVGNLVCPAMWDLGERAKVAILSVTEGDDKPLKYPDMFAAARLMVLTKTDLLPHVDFDVARCIEYARRVNPAIEVLLVSAKSGQGMEAWVEWLQGDAGTVATVPTPAAPLEAAA
ncbi:MAG: hydrogenase nickel incorporation protein HypB [Burkholderiaceae bacterium]